LGKFLATDNVFLYQHMYGDVKKYYVVHLKFNPHFKNFSLFFPKWRNFVTLRPGDKNVNSKSHAPISLECRGPKDPRNWWPFPMKMTTWRAFLQQLLKGSSFC
jgi:hypothetical protein